MHERRTTRTDLLERLAASLVAALLASATILGGDAGDHIRVLDDALSFVGAGVARPQHAGQRHPVGWQVGRVEERQQRVKAEAPLNVPAAPFLSGCAAIRVHRCR